MEVRPAKQEDWPALVALNKGHTFPFPDFKNIVDVFVVEDNGKIVTWAYTIKYLEVVFIPDVDSRNITKIKSLKLLSKKLVELTKARGIEQVHSYVKDEQFAKLLVERFNYGICTGIPLFLNIENDNG